MVEVVMSVGFWVIEVEVEVAKKVVMALVGFNDELGLEELEEDCACDVDDVLVLLDDVEELVVLCWLLAPPDLATFVHRRPLKVVI